MEISFKGSCDCGAVRLEAKGKPLFQGFCQCTDCRKAGSGHSAAITMLANDVTLTGEFRSYETQGSSGATVQRNFCLICGNRLFNSYPSAPEAISINATLLDDPEIFAPEIVLFAQSALPWDHIDPSIPRSGAIPIAKTP